jgi:hypothetical protein
MSQKERRWKKFYIGFYILLYGIAWPFCLLLFFMGEEKFPYALIPLTFALPTMKHNHIQRIREKEQSIW